MKNNQNQKAELRAIILPTYSKNEKYIDYCINAIDVLWPSHPDIWILSDRGKFRYDKYVIVRSPDWTEVLKKGINNLINREILNIEDYVLLLIEDHIPIDIVQKKLINSIAKYAVEKKLKFVSLFGHGKGDKVDEIHGINLYQIQENFPYYSEYHPAIWNLEHLNNILHRAILTESLDPWNAEKIRYSDIKHYTVDCIWPSEFSGFLKAGKVNIHEVRKMKHPALKDLKKILMKNWILSLPEQTVRRIYRAFKHLLFNK